MRSLTVIGLGVALAACGVAPLGKVPGAGTFRATMTGGSAGAANELTAAAAPALDLGLVARVVVNLDRVEVVPETGDPVEVALDPALPDSDGDGRPDLDLKALSGAGLILADGPLPAGRYAQFRLFSPQETGPDALSVYLEMKDGTKAPLRVPSGQQSGLKLVLDGGLEVEDGATTALGLEIDLARSLVATGGGRFMLKPVVKATVRATAGS